MIAQGLLLAGALYWSLGLFWAIYGLMRYKHDPSWWAAMRDVPVVALFCGLLLLWPFVMLGWIEENNDDGPWRG